MPNNRESFKLIDSEITLRKLEIFSVFMENQNLARTAEVLGMSSVSIHRALHSLEEGLQCPLFSHKGRLLKPLSPANVLYMGSKEVLNSLERTIEETRQAAGVGNQRLRLGTLYSLTVRTVPRLIMGTKLRRPKIEFDLFMGSNEYLLNELDQNRLDVIAIAIDELNALPPHMEVLPLFEDSLYLAAPKDFVHIPAKEIDLSLVKDKNFISLGKGFATSSDFKVVFEKVGAEPPVVAEVNDIFSVLNMVNAGVGMAILPGRVCSLYPSTVQFFPLSPRFQRKQNIGLVFKRSREHEPNILALVAEGRIFSREMLQRNLKV